jgi:beta-glucanase (GH16 family)
MKPLAFLILLALLLAACQQTSASPTASPTVNPPTETPRPTKPPKRGPTPTFSNSATPTHTPAPVSWQLVWSDEFDVTGAPDPEKWGYELGLIRNNEAQYYTDRPENARVEGGSLVITAIKEEYQGADYTSASLITLGKAEWTYGRVEVRAKIPTGLGTWPAIWMLGTNIDQVGWPACGEIDIMENVGFSPDTIYGTVHTRAYNHMRGTAKGAFQTLDAPYEDFHVYAVDWFSDHLDIYLDEKKYFTFWNENTGSDAWPYDQPFYLILNLAIGGAWGGQHGIDDSIFPLQYLIDYVRVYQAAE